MVRSAGLQVDGAIGVRVEPSPTGYEPRTCLPRRRTREARNRRRGPARPGSPGPAARRRGRCRPDPSPRGRRAPAGGPPRDGGGVTRTTAPATGRPVPSSVILPRTTTPRGRAMSTDCSIAPLGHSPCLKAIRYGAPSGDWARTPKRPAAAAACRDAESSLGVGLGIGRARCDQGMGDGPAGVGIGHAPDDRLGRLQGDRDRLGIGAGIDLDRAEASEG